MKKKTLLRLSFMAVSLAVLVFFAGCDLNGTTVDSSGDIASRRAGPPAHAGGPPANTQNEEESSGDAGGSAVLQSVNDNTISVPLLGGQHIDVGSVEIERTEDSIIVRYVTTGDWMITETHLHAALDLNDIPQVRGGPVPGHFAYGDTFDPPVTSAEYEINLNDYGFETGNTIFIAAHAVVQNIVDGEVLQEETAWGDGSRFVPRGNWATYIEYEIPDYVLPVECKCNIQTETAWGGDTAGGGNAWWYYYDASVGGVQTVWAGQDINVGTVNVVEGTVTITLTGDWELRDGNETVKIQGYNDNEIPSSRPAAGLFTGYKGTDLTVYIGDYAFYAVHLDVQLGECTCD